MIGSKTESKFMQLRQSFGIMKKANDGVAAIEFALVLPILVLIFFGLVESANLLTADARLRAATAAAGDMIAQVDKVNIEQNDLDDAWLGAQEIIKPIPTTFAGNPTFVIRVTVAKIRNNTTTIPLDVRWSRLLPNTSGSTTSILGITNPVCGTLMTSLPTGLAPPDASTVEQTDIVESTGVYEWRPWFSVVFKLPISLKTVNYNIPRYRPQMPLSAAAGGNCI